MRRPDQPMPRREPETDRRRPQLSRLLPFIVIGVFIVIILSEEMPGFRHAIDYYIARDSWQATETCNNKALQLGETPDFMRIIEDGDVHRTEKGFFIEKILVGEMAKQGGEQRFIVDCYTDPAGNLVRADRRDQ